MPGMRHVVHMLEHPSLCHLLQPFIVCLARLRALQLILQLQYAPLTHGSKPHAYPTAAVRSTNNSTLPCTYHNNYPFLPQLHPPICNCGRRSILIMTNYSNQQAPSHQTPHNKPTQVHEACTLCVYSVLWRRGGGVGAIYPIHKLASTAR